MIILAVKGDFSGLIILGILCGALAGNLDNLLRPRLVGKDTEMHDLFVLFGTLGGITLFGVLGIIIGPIIAALFITIWEIYGDAFSDWLPKVGEWRTDKNSTTAKPDCGQASCRSVDTEETVTSSPAGE
jgi:predicted PurR-regulated permease PerM